jgi:hypothetical protein
VAAAAPLSTPASREPAAAASEVIMIGGKT